MKLLFEKTYPLLMSIIAIILWWQLNLTFPKGDSIISATLSVAGIFVGFLATAKSILMTMSSPIMEDLRKSGYIHELVSYISQAIWFNLLFCVVNVVGYFIDQQNSKYALFWIFFSVSSLISFIRVTDIMLKIFRNDRK